MRNTLPLFSALAVVLAGSPLQAAQRPCTGTWRAGQDYFELPVAEQAAQAPQLLVRRYYTDKESRALETALASWLKSRPNVKPAYAFGIAEPQEFKTAQIDLALDALDRQDLRGKVLFDWVQETENRFTYRRGWHYVDLGAMDRLNTAFAAAHGIPEDVFRRVYCSFNLHYLLLKDAPRSGRDRMLVVTGRYATSLERVSCGESRPESPEAVKRLFALVDYLLGL